VHDLRSPQHAILAMPRRRYVTVCANRWWISVAAIPCTAKRTPHTWNCDTCDAFWL